MPTNSHISDEGRFLAGPRIRVKGSNKKALVHVLGKGARTTSQKEWLPQGGYQKVQDTGATERKSIPESKVKAMSLQIRNDPTQIHRQFRQQLNYESVIPRSARSIKAQGQTRHKSADHALSAKRKIDFSPDLLGVTKLVDAHEMRWIETQNTNTEQRSRRSTHAAERGKNDWRIDMQDLTALFAKLRLPWLYAYECPSASHAQAAQEGVQYIHCQP
ncbi:hypothetical protein CPB85DRAFT_1462230 [Mucidula mucida]|nr:hypothetical protein CPB85DRAFT_1462230 [Mucidula mucida]